MNRHLTGAVTQEQVDESWRYLVSEAREFHTVNVKDSARKAKTTTPTTKTEHPGGNVPEGSGRPAGSQGQAKKQDDRKKGAGKGKGGKAGKKQKGSRLGEGQRKGRGLCVGRFG